MNSLSSGCVAVLTAAFLCSPAYAAAITVIDLGQVLNDSISLPNASGTKTTGSGLGFSDYYEFTLPEAEFVSASMSISGPVADQIPEGTGKLIFSTWTSTGITAPFVPMGSTIEEATISAPANGGQTAVVGTLTPSGNFEAAGNYFVEITGVSGGGSLKLAIDGNVTAIGDPVPEPSTWAMMLIGLAGVGFAGFRTSRRAAMLM
jgi:hypothetical protein